jgi:hypothetical protein
MDLNENLKWERLEPEVRDAFEGGRAEKVQLKSGFRLYKFTHGDLCPREKTADGHSGKLLVDKVTPWWSPFFSYNGNEGLHGPFLPHHGDYGLQGRVQFCRQTGNCPVELTRHSAAVRTNWNNLTHVLTAYLTDDVWAFWGRASAQPKFGDQTIDHMRSFDDVLAELSGRQPDRITLPGGASQFYIPNLIRGDSATKPPGHIIRGVRMPVEMLAADHTFL